MNLFYDNIEEVFACLRQSKKKMYKTCPPWHMNEVGNTWPEE